MNSCFNSLNLLEQLHQRNTRETQFRDRFIGNHPSVGGDFKINPITFLVNELVLILSASNLFSFSHTKDRILLSRNNTTHYFDVDSGKPFNICNSQEQKFSATFRTLNTTEVFNNLRKRFSMEVFMQTTESLNTEQQPT